MEKNNNVSNNTDLNEALKKPTHFIVRYGITIITCMIIIAFASSFFIIIPQIETARIQKISKSDSNNIEIINVIVSTHNIGQLSRNSEIELGINKNKKVKGHIRNIRQNPNNCAEYEVAIYITDSIAYSEMKSIDIITNYSNIGEFLLKPMLQLF